jgi:hypothetical protein
MSNFGGTLSQPKKMKFILGISLFLTNIIQQVVDFYLLHFHLLNKIRRFLRQRIVCTEKTNFDRHILRLEISKKKDLRASVEFLGVTANKLLLNVCLCFVGTSD